jgi:glycosyltransferase involved in cell wall biosynthesis
LSINSSVKPTLLYASPLPPRETGIADYSAAVVRGLEQYYDITLYTDSYEIRDERIAHLPVKRHGIDRVALREYDHRLYQIGNNPWHHGYIYEACLQEPDTVVLHETVLYYLFIGLYEGRPDFYERLFRFGGPEAVAAVKAMQKARAPLLQFAEPARVPLNRELFLSSNRFLVHSAYAEERIRAATCGNACVHRVGLAQEDLSPPAAVDRNALFARLGLPADALLVTSFGFVAPTKQNEAVCRAVSRLNESGTLPVCYVMVGAGDYVSRYTGERIKITGYVSNAEYDEILACSDLVFNLRYPTMGETSAALLHAMWTGVPCVVCDIGWFSELPDDTVLKLDTERPELMEERVYETLRLFQENREVFRRLGEAGAAYVRREHSVAAVAERIRRCLNLRCAENR